MRSGVFLFGTVDMPDAGVNGPPAEKRRYGNRDFVRVYQDLLLYAQEAERLGYDAMWTAEHHFHDHGFEVVPNVLMLNAWIAQHTKRIKLGALIHVMTTWHPLRFAEDFAFADIVSNGRMLCGLGRGTEHRESAPFGVDMGHGGDELDRYNREVFEEQVEIFKRATGQEEFEFLGNHYVLPPFGLEFRGEPVTALPLVPRPVNTPVTIYQAVGSADTIEYAAGLGHVGVFSRGAGPKLIPNWQAYGEVLARARNGSVRKGEGRVLVVNFYTAPTRTEAMDQVRDGHDELAKLLWPNVITRNPALANRGPFTLEESMESGAYYVGSVSEVRDALFGLHDILGYEEIVIFPHFPGLRAADTIRQLRFFAEEILPALAEKEAREREGELVTM